MKVRFGILVILLVLLMGLLYWAGDRTLRQEALFQAPKTGDTTPLVVPPEPSEVAATQIPEGKPSAQEQNDELGPSTSPTPEVAGAVSEPATVQTAAAAPTTAQATTEAAIEPLQYDWLSPAQESQPGFVAPDRSDARLPNLVLRRPPEAPNLNRLFAPE